MVPVTTPVETLGVPTFAVAVGAVLAGLMAKITGTSVTPAVGVGDRDGERIGGVGAGGREVGRGGGPAVGV